MLDYRRPHCPGEIVAAGKDRHGYPATVREPQRSMGEERSESCRAAHTDEQALRKRVLPQISGETRGGIAERHRNRSDDDGNDDAKAIRQSPHQNAAQAKADYELKKNGYRQEDIAAAQADLERAKAEEIRTQLDFDRYEALAKKDLDVSTGLDRVKENRMVLHDTTGVEHDGGLGGDFEDVEMTY